MNIPQSYTDYLKKSNKINLKELADSYDEELLESHLIPTDQLESTKVKIHTECFKADMFMNFDEAGYYTIEYIHLLNYQGALVWYPELQCFGQSGNADHCHFFLLKDLTFDEIIANPMKYLIGHFEWDEGADFMITGSDLEAFPFEAKDDSDGWFLHV